ncbi:MAG: DUF6377 domain-containing protein [Rikenellaceae bacterium]
MKLLLYIILLCLPLKSYSHSKNINDVLMRLDESIENEQQYISIKEQAISKLKFRLNNSVTKKSRFIVANDLFEEYKIYQHDSAYRYAIMCSELAVERDDIAKAQCNLLLCYSNVGLFKEAAEIVEGFVTEGLSDDVVVNFYIAASQLYRSMRSYPVSSRVRASQYSSEQLKYRDLAMDLLPESTFDYRFLTIQNEVYRYKNFQESIALIKQSLETPNLSLRNSSKLYFALGSCYEGLGDRYNSIYYMALSAIADIESSTRQTLSAKILSNYMYERGDLKRASRYIHKAYNDVNFYNDPLRKLEIQAIMPQIDGQRYDIISQSLALVISVLVLFIALLAGVVVMFIKIKRRNIKLRLARQEIGDRAQMLESMNAQLIESNERLDHANNIKYIHIIKSLYDDIPFVERVEAISKIMNHQIRAKHYVDLLTELNRMDTRQERNRISRAFDSAFVKLYPTFIDEYNCLFAPEDQVIIEESEPMPAEVKIFALIRLGIDDISQISKYLNLSINTIYVYKTKAKSRSLVDNDEFEQRIKSIGTHI